MKLYLVFNSDAASVKLPLVWSGSTYVFAKKRKKHVVLLSPGKPILHRVPAHDWARVKKERAISTAWAGGLLLGALKEGTLKNNSYVRSALKCAFDNVPEKLRPALLDKYLANTQGDKK